MKEPFYRFPIGMERKRGVAASEAKITSEAAAGPNAAMNKWSILDSGLDHVTTTSPHYPFYASFKDVIGNYRDLRSYIENDIKERQGEAVGIEFGGIGSAAFSEFTPGFFETTVGVALVDHRPATADAEKIIAEDANRNHLVLEGDVLKDKTYQELAVLLGGRKADLIIERMWGGLDKFPDDPIVPIVMLQRWYELLNDHGLMLIEVPMIVKDVFEEWLPMAQKILQNTVELESNVHDWTRVTSLVLRLKKGDGAPDKLPFFSAKDAKRKTAGH